MEYNFQFSFKKLLQLQEQAFYQRQKLQTLLFWIQSLQSKLYKMSFTVKPIQAYLQKDLDTFSKMDPYVIIKIGNTINKSSTHQNGGKRPAWSDTFQIPANGQSLMKVQMYDQDVGKDDYIGQGTYNLQQLYNLPGKIQKQYIDIVRYGKKFGRILISLQYNGSSNQGYGGKSYQNMNACNNNKQPINWNNNAQKNNWNNGWGNTQPTNWNTQPNQIQNPQQPLNQGFNNNYSIPNTNNAYQNQNYNNVPTNSNQNLGNLWGNLKPGLLTVGLAGQVSNPNNNYPSNNNNFNQPANMNNGWNGPNSGWGNRW